MSDLQNKPALPAVGTTEYYSSQNRLPDSPINQQVVDTFTKGEFDNNVRNLQTTEPEALVTAEPFNDIENLPSSDEAAQAEGQMGMIDNSIAGNAEGQIISGTSGNGTAQTENFEGLTEDEGGEAVTEEPLAAESEGPLAQSEAPTQIESTQPVEDKSGGLVTSTSFAADEAATGPEEPSESAPGVVDTTEVDQARMKRNLNVLPDESTLVADQDRAVSMLESTNGADLQKEKTKELQTYLKGDSGFLSSAFKIIDFVFAPFMAPFAAAAAPLANPAGTGSFIGDLVKGAETSGAAFNERFFRWFDTDGDVMPDFSLDIVNNYMPNVPDQHKDKVALAIDLFADPLNYVGVGLARGLSKTMESITLGNKLATDFSASGIFHKSVLAAVGLKPGAIVVNKELKAIVDEAKRLDERVPDGTKKHKSLDALSRQLDKYLEGRPNKGMPLGSDEAIEAINITMRGRTRGRSFTITDNIDPVTGVLDEQAVVKSIKLNEVGRRIKFNLNATKSAEQFATTMEKAVEEYGELYNSVVKPTSSKEEFIARSMEQNELLSEYMGTTTTLLKDKDSYAFRQILESSSLDLIDLASAIDDPLLGKVGKEAARLAFAKQWVAHLEIQAKVVGDKSDAGTLLKSYDVEKCF